MQAFDARPWVASAKAVLAAMLEDKCIAELAGVRPFGLYYSVAGANAAPEFLTWAGDIPDDRRNTYVRYCINCLRFMANNPTFDAPTYQNGDAAGLRGRTYLLAAAGLADPHLTTGFLCLWAIRNGEISPELALSRMDVLGNPHLELFRSHFSVVA